MTRMSNVKAASDQNPKRERAGVWKIRSRMRSSPRALALGVLIWVGGLKA